MEKSGALAKRREKEKNEKYKAQLAAKQIHFVPFIMEFNGGYGEQAQDFFSDLVQPVKDKLNIENAGAMIANFRRCISFKKTEI